MSLGKCAVIFLEVPRELTVFLGNLITFLIRKLFVVCGFFVLFFLMFEGLFLWSSCGLKKKKKLIPLCAWVHVCPFPRYCVGHSGCQYEIKNKGNLFYFPQRLEGPLYLSEEPTCILYFSCL